MVQTIFSNRTLRLQEWAVRRIFSEMNRKAGFASFREDLLMESLILAQSERWRRA